MASAKLKYLQITGVSHSGTTLLAFLLNAHDEIVSGGEMSPAAHVNPNFFSCSCRKEFTECEFYCDVEARVQQSVPEFRLDDWQTRFRVSGNRYLQKALVGNLMGARSEAVRDLLFNSVGPLKTELDNRTLRVESVARAAVELTGSSVYADTTKNPRRVAYLKNRPGLDIYLIHVLKDVRQGVVSSTKRGRGTVAEGAAAWKRGNLAAHQARRYVPDDHFMTIRYDEFARNPQETMDQISRLVGVNPCPIPENFFSAPHHIVGNNMRLSDGIGAVRSDDSWKSRLSDEDLIAVAKIAGKTNRLLGFDWPK